MADFRDPWTSIGYHKKLKLTKNSQRKHKELEHRVLNDADRIIVTSNTTKEEFKAITKKPITVITNGFDSDYLGGVELDTDFTISHIGSLLSGRNPVNLWQVLSTLIQESEAFKQNFKLKLAGVISEDVLQRIYDYGLENYTELVGYLSHENAVKLQQRSQVLLLVEIDSDETKGILPGTLYEYMAAKRPILAIGPKGWEAGQIISDTKTGTTFEYHSQQSDIKNVILEWFVKYQQNNLKLSSSIIKKYSRRELTKELSKLL